MRASDTATAVSASLTSSTVAALHAAGDWPYPKADMNHFVPLLNRLDALLESAVAAHKVELVETRAAGTGAGQEVNTEMVDAATATPSSSNAASSVEPTATSSNAVPAPSSNTMSTATSGATTTSPTVPFVVVFRSGEASAIATKHLLLGILRFTRLLHENATNRNLYNSYEVEAQRDDVMANEHAFLLPTNVYPHYSTSTIFFLPPTWILSRRRWLSFSGRRRG